MGKSTINLRKAKFFCENCGEEVPQNAKVCTKCGKFFTFVRCPNCFFTGDSKKFSNGCPKCGYAVKPYGGFQTPNIPPQKPDSKNKSRKLSKSGNSDSSLPVWVYIVTIVVLIAVILGIYSCL